MSGILQPLRCDHCGEPVEPTPAAMAAGGVHPVCAMPAALRASLTASGAHIDADALALARWAVRMAARRSPQAVRPQRSAPVALAASAAPSPERPRKPQPTREANAARLLGIVKEAGRRPDVLAVQRRAREELGADAAAEAWAVLVSGEVVRVAQPGRYRSLSVVGVDESAWESLRIRLARTSRRTQP